MPAHYGLEVTNISGAKSQFKTFVKRDLNLDN